MKRISKAVKNPKAIFFSFYTYFISFSFINLSFQFVNINLGTNVFSCNSFQMLRKIIDYAITHEPEQAELSFQNLLPLYWSIRKFLQKLRKFYDEMRRKIFYFKESINI